MMSKKILIYTALFGDYDKLLEPDHIDINCDYICVTDDQNLVSDKWKILLDEPKNDPVTMNRMYKMLPHKFFSSYDIAMYVDANIQLKSPPSFLIKKYSQIAPIAFPKHFLRNCIYEEAKACLKHKKINDEEYAIITEGLLKKDNFPPELGLAENNILIRNIHNPEVVHAMEKWWEIFESYAQRDQLSLMYVLWKEKLNYVFMKESSRNNNKFFSYELHKSNNPQGAIKNKLISMAAMRDKNIVNKWIAKFLDKL